MENTPERIRQFIEASDPRKQTEAEWSLLEAYAYFMGKNSRGGMITIAKIARENFASLFLDCAKLSPTQQNLVA